MNSCGFVLSTLLITMLVALDFTVAMPLVFDQESSSSLSHGQQSAVFKPLRAKRSFDRLDSSPFGFSAYARAFIGDQRLAYAQAATRISGFDAVNFNEVPKRRMRYNFSDGYLFGRR